jgi:hypothetical protein
VLWRQNHCMFSQPIAAKNGGWPDRRLVQRDGGGVSIERRSVRRDHYVGQLRHPVLAGLSGGAHTMRAEEIRPRHDLRILFEQCSALPLGHAAPDAVFDVVVECMRPALLHNRTVAADHRSFALRGSLHK